MTPWMKANREKIPELMNRKRRSDGKRKPQKRKPYFVRPSVGEFIEENEARQRRIAKARELNQAAKINARIKTLEGVK